LPTHKHVLITSGNCAGCAGNKGTCELYWLDELIEENKALVVAGVRLTMMLQMQVIQVMKMMEMMKMMMKMTQMMQTMQTMEVPDKT
jgi:hypothetical protein